MREDLQFFGYLINLYFKKLLLYSIETFKVLICKLLDHVTLTVESFFVTMFQICGVMSHDETNKI